MTTSPPTAASSAKDRWWIAQTRAAPYLFVLPFVLLFCVFLLYPLARSMQMSFYRMAGPRHQEFVGLGNYRQLLFHDRRFLWAVANTAIFTVSFLILQIPASLGLAILLNSRLVRFRNVFRFAFFSSYLVGPVFVAVVFEELFRPRGFLNELIGAIRGSPFEVSWLSKATLVMPAILIASLWLSVGFGMIYFLAGLQAIDPQLYEAANVDGAGRWRRIWHITLPGLRPVLAYVVLVGTIGAFQLFEIPYVLLGGAGPSYAGLTIVMFLFATGFQTGDLGYASAIGWLLVLILLIVAIAQVRLMRSSEREA